MNYDPELKAWFRTVSPSWSIRQFLRWRKTCLRNMACCIYLNLEGKK